MCALVAAQHEKSVAALTARIMEMEKIGWLVALGRINLSTDDDRVKCELDDALLAKRSRARFQPSFIQIEEEDVPSAPCDGDDGSDSNAAAETDNFAESSASSNTEPHFSTDSSARSDSESDYTTNSFDSTGSESDADDAESDGDALQAQLSPRLPAAPSLITDAQPSAATTSSAAASADGPQHSSSLLLDAAVAITVAAVVPPMCALGAGLAALNAGRWAATKLWR